jgi:pyrroloquinoline quinone (PQQ) biosynthesis protein C
MKLEIQASGTPKELLALDAKKSENRVLEHPVWEAALEGSLPKPRLKKLLLAFYPTVAGTARYAYAAKISQIDAEDGKELFLQVHEQLKNPAADADEGWKRMLVALGASERELREARAQPSAEAADLVEVIREHGLRSGPVEASVVAFMLEQHLPRLWGRLADSLQKNYGVKSAELAHLRYEAARADKVEKWVKHLVEKYVAGADTYKMYEARRAAREALWAWTALTESVQ